MNLDITALQPSTQQNIHIEEGKNANDKMKLWIIPQNAAGFGDIACALKITNHLLENCGFLNNNVSVVTEKKDIVKVFNEAVQIINPKDAIKIPSTSLPHLKIVCPIRSYENINKELFKDKIPCMVLWEYGIKNLPLPIEFENIPSLVETLGLEDGELGIVIDKDEHTYSKFRWKERVSLLHKINPIIQNAILGEDASSQSLEKFYENSRLYFGYTANADYLINFFQGIVEINHKNDNNLVFVFPTDNYLNFPQNFDKIASIETFIFNKNNNSICMEKKEFSNEGKKITIILGTMSYNDVKWIQIAAKKETIVTGDQSLGQAISLIFSRFIYECLPHKCELANSLKKLYPINPTILEIKDNQSISTPSSKNMVEYFISCKKDKEKFSCASREISQNRNVFLKLPALMQKLVNKNNL
ncbi:MAG: hypothetical protein H0V82_13100 [Candidatus Protochlamydia sp.]|nr:hypothetical protein [Candidatus Protochlamydia sp.]